MHTFEVIPSRYAQIAKLTETRDNLSTQKEKWLSWTPENGKNKNVLSRGNFG